MAGNIFRNKISNQKIDLTTPVQASQSEKIAMTTPVTVSGASTFTLAFIMSAEYTLETLPQLKDNYVHLKRLSARSMADIRFSGCFQKETIQKKSSVSLIG